MLSSSVALSHVFIARCSSFDIIARIETVSFHFQSLKCTLTIQWCETLVLKIECTGQRLDHLLKYCCSSGNGLWYRLILAEQFCSKIKIWGAKNWTLVRKVFSPVTAVFSTSGATVLGKIHWDLIAVNSIIVKPPRVMIDSRTRNEAASDDWFSNRKRNATITSTRQSKLKSLIKAPSTRIRRFLYPQIFLCGYKNICVHT